MEILYPLLFNNIFKPVLWGGNRLKPLKGLPQDSEAIGESWEVSDMPSAESIVTNGPLSGMKLSQLTKEYGALLVGKSVLRKYGNRFPILVKYIDAAKDLSIQVHPDDAMALSYNFPNGKTEMWFIIRADEGAFLYSGLKSNSSVAEIRQALDKGTICDLLARHEVHAGDVFFIPPGRIHAIGGGVLLAEIQQNCDLTYRLYDYGRLDSDGKPRELHTELALQATDYNAYDDYTTNFTHQINKPVTIVSCKYFVTKLLEVDRPFHRKLYKYDSFIIYMCLVGNCTITIKSTQGFGFWKMPDKQLRQICLTEGNSCLIPASVADFHVSPDNPNGITQLLEVYIDNKNFG